MAGTPLFRSFLIGGFECSSHRLRSGKRLDLLTATDHDRFIQADYKRLQEQGIYTVRSGLRWHLIESGFGHYDFSSALPEIRTAQQMGMQVIWDVCHYGWPDDLDILKPAFVRHFARFAAAFAHILKNETDTLPFLCPINEISFFAWGGGDAAYLNPFQRGRGYELKVQLVRAAIEAIEAIWQVLPEARIVHTDPILNITPASDRPHDQPWAEGHRLSQYQAWDMLAGRSWPLLGGDEKYLDIIGLNYYPTNQWIHGGPTLHPQHELYRPFRQIAHEVYERYGRPMFVAETGTEGEERSAWLRYMGQEASALIEAGVPLEGLCIYPILNHPGWDDDRHCHNGLWDYADEQGYRELYEPLGTELQRQSALIEVAREAQVMNPHAQHRTLLLNGVRKPRVCLFTDSLEPSGLGEHMLALASELHKTYDVSFICPATPHSQALLKRAAALPITVLPLEVRGQSRIAWEQLRDWLRTHGIDIFHSHAGIGWEGHDAIYAAHHAGVPIILRTEHLPYLLTDWEQRASHAELMRKVTRLVCVSEGAYNSFIQAGIAPSQLSMIRNGIIPPLGKTSRAHGRVVQRAALKLPHNAKVVLTVGRLTEQKGHRYLLKAAAAIVAAQPDVHFVWVGDGPLAEHLRAESEARGLTKWVHLLGQRDDVADLLAASDLFVLPSLFEGLPLVVLEAMAASIPVIATQVPGTDEIIEDGRSGRLVMPGDEDALTVAILDAFQQPQLLQHWKTMAHSRFKEHFTAHHMAQAVDSIYQQVLQQAGFLPAPQKASAPYLTHSTSTEVGLLPGSLPASL